MKILTFSASLRKESLNTKLVSWVVKRANQLDFDLKLQLVNLQVLDIPIYDGDIEEAHGVPRSILDLASDIEDTDGLIISTPEYNGSIPGTLKNLIDWVSRITPIPFRGKQLLLLSASPSDLGGVRSLWHSRVPFEVIGTYVFPEMFGLAKADTKFSPDGSISDEATQKSLDTILIKFFKHVQTTLN